MATELAPYQSVLPTLLKELGGTKTTTSVNSNANTAPLEEVFRSAMTASGMGVPEMTALIESIFREGATKVPELASLFANSTGSRVSGNSGLNLAAGDLNRQITTAAMTALLGHQNTNRTTAANAATGIAQATKGSTTTQTQKAGTNPLIGLAIGTALNKFGSSNMSLQKMMSKIFGGENADPMGISNPSPDIGEMNTGMVPGVDGGGFDGGFDFGADLGGGTEVFDYGADLGGSALDIGSAGDTFDFGADLGGIELGGFGELSPGFEDFGDLNLDFGFADGGSVNRKPRRGPDGGVLDVNKNINAMPARYKEMLLKRAADHGLNVGDDFSKLIEYFVKDAQRAPTEGLARESSSQATVLRNLNNLMFNPGAAQFGSIFDGAPARSVEEINSSYGFADGGIIRNKNYMGESSGGTTPITGGGSGNSAGAGTTTGGGASTGNTTAAPTSRGLFYGLDENRVLPADVLEYYATLSKNAAAGGANNDITALNFTGSNGKSYMGFNSSEYTNGPRTEEGYSILPGNQVDRIREFDPLMASDPDHYHEKFPLVKTFGTDGNLAGIEKLPQYTSGTAALTKGIMTAVGMATGNPALAFARGVGTSALGDAANTFGGGDSVDPMEVFNKWSGYEAPATAASTGPVADTATAAPTSDAPVTAMRNGGLIRGPGTGISDSITAQHKQPGGSNIQVSDEEYIFPADVVRYWGTKKLDQMKNALHTPAGAGKR